MLGLNAEAVGTFLTGLGLALIALLGGRGAKEASQRKAPEQTFEIAGAIISDKKVDELVQAFRSHELALDRNTEACKSMNDTLEDIERGVTDLATEHKIDRALRGGK